MEDKLKKIIEVYKEKTAKECYKITCVEGEPSILDDKIGGKPYLPIGQKYPLDKEKNPMILLIQINLKNIDLEGWPKSGILEIFVDEEFDSPCNYVIKHFKEGLKYQAKLPEIDLDYFAIKEPMKIELSKDICHMPLDDYRSEKLICNITNELYGTNIDSIIQLEEVTGVEDWDEQIIESINNPFATIGGYADFRQDDPREDKIKDKDECLVKIDSCLDDRIEVGDEGVIYALISQKDIRKCKFKKAFLDWDCY